MKLQPAVNPSKNNTNKPFAFRASRNLGRAQILTEADKHEILSFLKLRPVHTVVMTSFINDNGIASADNRGRFYGFRNLTGRLEGVALIGHTTLVEARSEQAVTEFARVAGESETPIHFMMSDGSTIENLWNYFVADSRAASAPKNFLKSVIRLVRARQIVICGLPTNPNCCRLPKRTPKLLFRKAA